MRARAGFLKEFWVNPLTSIREQFDALANGDLRHLLRTDLDYPTKLFFCGYAAFEAGQHVMSLLAAI